MSLKKLGKLTSDEIRSVSRDTLKRYCSCIERLEAEHWKTGGLVQDTIETINFDVGSKSETDTASESSSIDWEFIHQMMYTSIKKFTD